MKKMEETRKRKACCDNFIIHNVLIFPAEDYISLFCCVRLDYMICPPAPATDAPSRRVELKYGYVNCFGQ